ncbi:MAG: hypothetical protein DRP74_00535 [Candidatus Omnitrophota bacterium]|nr:MAG: hypothetical protein DRP74_00535 [Candidatus Omnitrophota bacterium]
MQSVSDSFRNNLEAKVNKPFIRFLFGDELVVDGGLEEWTGNLLDQWNEWNILDTVRDLYKEDYVYHSDYYAAKLATQINDRRGFGGYQKVTLETNKPHLVSAWIYFPERTTGAAYARVYNPVDDYWAEAKIIEANTDWEYSEASGEPTVEDNWVYFELANETSGQVYFDDISLKRAGEDLLIGISQISRSTEITSGFASIELSNINKDWNIFLEDKTNLGKLGKLRLQFVGSDEYMDVFTGTVESVYHSGAKISLHIKDRMLPMLEKELGSGQSPMDYYSSDWNPADLVWDILVNQGKLDPTTSIYNEDIDYSSWSQWKEDCDTLSFRLKARFTGHTIKTALSMIAELTNSYIWVDGDGKFHFKRPIPPYAPGELIDFNRSNCIQIDASLDKGNLINKAVCYYGYDPDSDDFTGSYTAEDATSQSNYGIKEKIIENKVVWHSTSGSAKSYADRVVDKNKQPLEVLSITATMVGYLLQLGDDITVTEDLKGLNTNPARVEEIESIDLRTGLVKFKAREISDEALVAFWLDDAYYGLLDQDYNPLY